MISEMIYNKKKLLILIIFLMLFFLIEKIILSTFLYEDVAIEQLGFGMGGYVQALKAGFGFQNCDAQNFCNYSNRMPGVPVIIYVLSFLSDTQLGISIFKSITFSIICFFVLLLNLRLGVYNSIKIRILQVYLGTYSIVVLMLPFAKHSSSITYEEAYFIELLIPWIIVNAILIEGIVKKKSFKFDSLNSLNIILAFIFFLIKSSMIVLFLWSILLFTICCFSNSVNRRIKISLISLSICFLVSSLWIGHNFNSGGGFKLLSSWDGENLFRGNNAISAKIYPDISLDRITDSDTVVLRNGEVVKFSTFPARKYFRDEWEWSAYYKRESLKWALSEPTLWLQFQFIKTFNFFFSIQMTPFSVDTDARRSERTKQQQIYDYLVMVWLIVGRLFFISSIGVIIRELLSNRDNSFAWISFLLLPTCLYAAPYIIGVNYERHISPFLLMYVVLLFFLISLSKKKSRLENDAKKK